MATSEQLRDWRNCPRCGTALEHGEETVACPSCGLQEYANPAPTASAVVRDGEMLFLARRAGEPGKGLWDLVGGFRTRARSRSRHCGASCARRPGARSSGRVLDGLPDRYGDEGIWTINSTGRRRSWRATAGRRRRRAVLVPGEELPRAPSSPSHTIAPSSGPERASSSRPGSGAP